MDNRKHGTVFIYNGILFGLYKGGNSYNNLDRIGEHYVSEISQVQNGKFCMLPFMWNLKQFQKHSRE
jgi:hypothetical protein